MDFNLEIDEKEKEGMELTIDGLTIIIPENLVEERMNLVGETRGEIQKEFERKAYNLKECFVMTNKYNPSTFEKLYIDYLDSELDIFRP